VEPNLPANYYARALRAIGQDLGDFFPHLLEIEERERTFFVHLRCDRKRSESKAPPLPAEAPQSGLRGIFHKLHTIRLDKPPDKADLVDVNRTYHPIDISRIDEAGLQRRIKVGRIPDIHDLGEALRTIGRIVDAEEGRFVKLFRDQRRVAFEYVVRGSEIKKIEMTRTELYKVQQSYYHGRSGPASLDLWKGKA
jgi:hypothetical protein